VLAHRLMLDTKARYSGRSKEDVVRELLTQVPLGL
jgi:MoxR-like ATPase